MTSPSSQLPSSIPRPLTVFVRDPSLRRRVCEALARLERPYEVREAPAENASDPILVDRPGLEILKPHRQPGAPTIVLDEQADLVERVRLLGLGVAQVVDATNGLRQLDRAIESVERGLTAGGPLLADFAVSPPSMQKLYRQARRLVGAPSSVLITGETGVGKEHLAQAIHAEGPRAGAPFLVVNCSALPESLLESQLFGHVRGAFTGADRAHSGFFVAAGGGTLLLDEIGEMPLHLQVKLLNVIERHEVTPVGSSKPVAVDLRVMAATNRDLRREVEEDRFREDLFYRLNVVELHVPPLRERPEQIPDLAGAALHELRGSHPRRRVGGVDAAALEAMTSYSWPGNVRELRNVIERAILLGRRPAIGLEDLPAALRGERAGGATQDIASWLLRNTADWFERPLSEVRATAVAEVERIYLSKALARTGGSIRRTAEMVGIGCRSLYDKMKRYGLSKADFRR